MLAVGGAAIRAGGPWFQALCVLAGGAMLWELGRLVAPTRALRLGAVGAAGVLWVLHAGDPLLALPGVAVPALAVMGLATRLRAPAAAYALAIVLAAAALSVLRDASALVLLWLVAVVVMSDVAGYFAGRLIGGPKFWPAISPKKTWSGTVAGWLGALAVGFVAVTFAPQGQGAAALVWLAPLAAFAGQLGDITESWFKRRCDVKDSSALIPGHGGVLDRFDALIFASLVVGAVHLAAPALLLPGG